jgi:hypothetical protein
VRQLVEGRGYAAGFVSLARMLLLKSFAVMIHDLCPGIMQDIAGVLDVRGAAVGDHQKLPGAHMFLILQEVLLGHTPPDKGPQNSTPSGARHSPLNAAQEPQECRRQWTSDEQMAEPWNPSALLSFALLQSARAQRPEQAHLEDTFPPAFLF